MRRRKPQANRMESSTYLLYPSIKGIMLLLLKSYIGSEGMIETDSKRLSGLSTELNNPFSNGASQNLWVFKPQLPKK